MKETNVIPEKTNYNSTNIYKAIDSNDYELAEKFSSNYLNSHSNGIDNVISVLLKRIVKLSKKIEKKEYSFAAIFDAFMKNDIDRVLRLLKVYLNSINKKEYEFLIVNLIKISLIEKDEFFIKPISELMKLDKEDYKFNSETYIAYFNEMNRLDKKKEASIYLDIIGNYNNLTPKKDNIIYDDIKEKGLIIVEGSIKDNDQLCRVLKEHKNLKLINIGEDKSIIKYSPYLYNNNFGNLVKEAMYAYDNRNFMRCIKMLRKVLEFGDLPKAWVFVKIGFAYWNINNIPLAIDYLTVATELSKNEDSRYDFTNLIETLKKQENKKELKLKN